MKAAKYVNVTGKQGMWSYKNKSLSSPRGKRIERFYP